MANPIRKNRYEEENSARHAIPDIEGEFFIF